MFFERPFDNSFLWQREGHWLVARDINGQPVYFVPSLALLAVDHSGATPVAIARELRDIGPEGPIQVEVRLTRLELEARRGSLNFGERHILEALELVEGGKQ